jgi:hypothetical protein
VPLGIPTQTLLVAGFPVGPCAVEGWAGTIYGDPAVTFAIGPVELQNIKLLLDPIAGSYSGNAELYIGSAVSGSVEKATEARIAAECVVVEVPVAGTAEAGIRTILRLVGKEGSGRAWPSAIAVGHSASVRRSMCSLGGLWSLLTKHS